MRNIDVCLDPRSGFLHFMALPNTNVCHNLPGLVLILALMACLGCLQEASAQAPDPQLSDCSTPRGALDVAKWQYEFKETGLYDCSEKEVGSKLAVGDFDGSDDFDLAVSVGSASSSSVDCWPVHIIHDPLSSPLDVQGIYWKGVTNESNAKLGAQLASADLNGDSRWELLIAAPGYDSNFFRTMAYRSCQRA